MWNDVIHFASVVDDGAGGSVSEGEDVILTVVTN